MIVLDSNVLSELMRPAPDRAVVDWLDGIEAGLVFTTAITVAEILYGIERLPEGKRRHGFAEQAGALFDDELAGRILPFDEAAAVHYARHVAARESAGRPIGQPDGQIAAICLEHGASLATRNVDDFALLPLDLLDPWVDAVR